MNGALWGVRHKTGSTVVWGVDPVTAAWFVFTHTDCCVLAREASSGWVEVPLVHPQARCAVCSGFATRAFEVEQDDGRWTRMSCDDPGCRWDAGEPLSDRPLTIAEAEAITGDELSGSGVASCA